jgi:hypothetical protein
MLLGDDQDSRSFVICFFPFSISSGVISHGTSVHTTGGVYFCERPANPIPPPWGLGIMFADDAWLIERETRMTVGSGELGYSACLPALVGKRGRESLDRKRSFH